MRVRGRLPKARHEAISFEVVEWSEQLRSVTSAWLGAIRRIVQVRLCTSGCKSERMFGIIIIIIIITIIIIIIIIVVIIAKPLQVVCSPPKNTSNFRPQVPYFQRRFGPMCPLLVFLLFIFFSFSPNTMLSGNLRRKNIPKVFSGFFGGP